METSDSDGSISPPPSAGQHRSRLRKKSREKKDQPSRGSRDNILSNAFPENENSSPSRRLRRPEHGNCQSSPRHNQSKEPGKPDSGNQQQQNSGTSVQMLKEAIFGTSSLSTTNSTAAAKKVGDNAELTDTDREPFRVIQPTMSDANSESEEDAMNDKSSQENEKTKQLTEQYKKDKPEKHKNYTTGMYKVFF